MAQQYYSPVSVNSGQVPSAQTNFPMLVSQIDNRFRTTGNGGHVNNANGYDIRPYADSGLTTPLTYELERYNASTGEVIMWVLIPTLSSPSTPLYLGYGDTTLTTDGSSAATWSNAFYSVSHFTNGTVLNLHDSAIGNPGTGVNTPTATAGQIDGAMALLSASTQYAQSAAFAVAGETMTLSAWVRATSFPGAENAVLGYNTGPNVSYTLLMVNSGGKLACYNQARNYDGTGTHTLSSGVWYYLAMTLDVAVGIIGYVNGAVDGNAAGAISLDDALLNIAIGDDVGNAGRSWNGAIDEARIASVARSANWLLTEYNNQGAPGTFETLGAETALGGGGTGGSGSHRRQGDRNLFGGDRNLMDRAYGPNRRGDRGLR